MDIGNPAIEHMPLNIGYLIHYFTFFIFTWTFKKKININIHQPENTYMFQVFKALHVMLQNNFTR